MISKVLKELEPFIVINEAGRKVVKEEDLTALMCQHALSPDAMGRVHEALELRRVEILLSGTNLHHSQASLVELYHSKKAEVFENAVFEGGRRYYIEDLTERNYNLEHTTPYQIEMLGYVIEERSWGILLCKVAELLLGLFPERNEDVFSFRCKWSKQEMFTKTEKTNYKPVKEDLFINCNHTALHSCWFLQDLLDFFEVDKSSVNFLIRRPSGAEPKNIREYIEKRFKKKLTGFLCTAHDKTNEQVEKIIALIDKHLNRMLASITKSHSNFFLFDDNAVLANYVKKVREMIDYGGKYDEKAKKTLNKYLDFIVQCYKSK